MLPTETFHLPIQIWQSIIICHLYLTCPRAVCCCNLRFDRHVDRKSRNCVLYRRVVRCGVAGAGKEFGDPLGGIIN